MSIKKFLIRLMGIFHGKKRKYSLLEDKYQREIAELRGKIKDLENKITTIEKHPLKSTTINRYLIREMNVERFEMNIDAIDVDEVNGALNVGIIHSSMVNKDKEHSTQQREYSQIVSSNLGSSNHDRKTKQYPSVIIGEQAVKRK